jgi:glycosyltransferase involved in cell wall biosynthesis
MRIVHVIDSGGIGGIEKHVETLCAAQRAAGYSASVLLYQAHPSPWPGVLKQVGVPFDVAGGLRGLFRRLRSSRPHVVHTHGYKAGVIGRIICRLMGIPVVSAYHAGERGPFPVSLYQRIDEATSSLCPRLAVSRQIAARLPAPVRVVNNFVSLAPLDAARELPACVAFVGRLSEEKGPDLFCELAARLALPDEAWVIYGDGPMRAGLEGAYGGQVTFRGMVTNMNAEWARIGALVMTSRAEGLPYAALEALAHGVPVLAHAVGGLPDLLAGRPDWLTQRGQAPSWPEALARWRAGRLADSRAWRAAARALVAQAYSPEACLPQIFEAYREAGAAV